MTERDLGKLYLEYLNKYAVMALATGSDGAVGCTSVFYGVDSAGNILFGSARSTQKANNMARNPRVALAMTDGKSGMGVQVRGTASALEGSAAAAAKDLLQKRHPTVAAFYDKPDMVFFRVTATERCLINFSWGTEWRQNVTV